MEMLSDTINNNAGEILIADDSRDNIPQKLQSGTE